MAALHQNSEAANVLSKTLGDRTVMTGSISQGRDKSKSLQMTGRPLMTPDELKSCQRYVHRHKNRRKAYENEAEAVF